MAEDDRVSVTVEADASGGVTAFDALAASVDKLGGSLTGASGKMASMADAAESTVIPHRAAHQAMNLVGADLIAMTGAGSAAVGPMHLLSSTLFAVAMGGAAVSAPFIAMSVVIAAASYAMKTLTADTKDNTKAQSDALTVYKSDADILDAYTAAGGRLTASLQALHTQINAGKQATLSDMQAKAAAALSTDQLTVANDKLAISASKAYAAEHGWTAQMMASDNAFKIATDVLRKHEDQLILDQQAVTALSNGYATWQEYIKSTTTVLNSNKKAADEAWAVYNDLNAQAAKYISAQEEKSAKAVEANKKEAESFARFSTAASLGTEELEIRTVELSGSLDKIPAKYDKMEMAALKYYADEGARIQVSSATRTQKDAQMVNLEQQKTSRLIAIGAQEQAAKEQQIKQWLGVAQNADATLVSSASSAFLSIRSGFSNSVASMIVEGKNFGASMHQVFIQAAEQVISKLIEVEVVDRAINLARQGYAIATGATQTIAAEEAAVATLATDKIVKIHEAATSLSLAVLNAEAFGALGGPLGSAASGSAEFEIASPWAAATAAATGADFIADRPTRMLVGEGGQSERVTVTPISQGGGGTSSGGGGDTVVTFTGDIVVNGIQNPRAFADQIALLVTQAIRGRAQINLVGKSIH